MKKILVTGSNGLLGQTLTELILSGQRAHLTASSKGENRYPIKKGYTYLNLDISDSHNLEQAISSIKPDVVINTAAITNVDVCHTERALCDALNVEAVRSLTALCSKYNSHLIHLSTDFVFDGLDGPYSEDAQPRPLSYYGESKYKAEQIIQDSDCKWSIVRTILVYGVTAQMSRSNIVLWAKSSLESGKVIRVVDDQWRMPTLALDLAEACLLIADKEEHGIFHISGKDMMSVCELVQTVARYWGLDKSLIEPVSSAALNQEARRPGRTGFILDKAIERFGYQPHSFIEGLRIVDKQLASLGS